MVFSASKNKIPQNNQSVCARARHFIFIFFLEVFFNKSKYSSMSLIYALIARSTTVLVEYSAYSGNFSTVAIQCLPRAPAPATAGADARTTFTADAHAFHMQVSDGFTFLVVAETTAGRQVPFACLDRIKEDFLRKHGAEARTAIAHSMDGTYASALKGHRKSSTSYQSHGAPKKNFSLTT